MCVEGVCSVCVRVCVCVRVRVDMNLKFLKTFFENFF